MVLRFTQNVLRTGSGLNDLRQLRQIITEFVNLKRDLVCPFNLSVGLLIEIALKCSFPSCQSEWDG